MKMRYLPLFPLFVFTALLVPLTQAQVPVFVVTPGTSTVKFNGVSAGTAASWSATSIIVSVPSGAATGSVVVNVSGLASNGLTFTVASSSGGVEPWVYGPGGAIYFTGGNVGIGTLNPQNALSVNGIVQAKEVMVNTGWRGAMAASSSSWPGWAMFHRRR